MVGSDDKQSIFEPWLPAGGLKETFQGIVGIGNALLQGAFSLWEAALVLLGHDKGIVR